MISPTRLRRDGYVLITGGAGFLGTNLADALARRCEDVVVFDNLSRQHVQENLIWLTGRHPGRISTIIADVRDVEALREAVRGARAVIHLAAQVAVTTSLLDPLEDFEINARGTLNLLEAVRYCSPQTPVLFASTNKVYGKLLDDDQFAKAETRYRPLDTKIGAGFAEGTPLSFYSPYGCSKGAADQYVVDYSRVFGLKTAVLRMSCLYGPHQFGTEDQGWVAHFLIRALKNEPIVIYGDGYQLRDVLHVDDAVRAYLRCLDHMDTIGGRAFNLGGGADKTLSLRELLARIKVLQGKPPEVTFRQARPGDQLWYVSDTSALQRAVGWRASVTLDEGLADLQSWLHDRFVMSREAVA